MSKKLFPIVKTLIFFVLIGIFFLNDFAFAETDILQERTQPKQESGTVIQSFGKGSGKLKISIGNISISPGEKNWLEVILNGRSIGKGEPIHNSHLSSSELSGEILVFEKSVPLGIYHVEVELRFGTGNLADSKTIRSVQIVSGQTTIIDGAYECGTFLCDISIHRVHSE